MTLLNTKEYQSKIENIKKFNTKYLLVYKECPYTLAIRIHQKRPLITLIGIDFETLLKDYTIEIKIPNIVEAIDTQDWYRLQRSWLQARLQLRHIVLIGNNKPIYGNLIGAFSIPEKSYNDVKNIDLGFDREISLITQLEDYNNLKQTTKHNIDPNMNWLEYAYMPEIRDIKIENFNGENIHDIQYICKQLQKDCSIDLRQLHLKTLHKLDNIQSYGNLLDTLLEQGIKFKELQSIVGFSNSSETWRNSLEIDIVRLGQSKLKNISGAFEDCINLRNIQMDNTLDNQVYCDKAFYKCENLKNCPEELNKVKIKSQRSMFEGSGIVEIPKLNLTYTKDIYSMFSMCSNLKRIELDGHGQQFNTVNAQDLFLGQIGVETISIKNIRFTGLESLVQAFQSMPKLKIAIFENIEITQKNDLYLYGMLQYNSNLKKVIFKNIKITSPVRAQDMFLGSISLEEIRFENVTIDSLVQPDQIFKDCNSLRVIDTSGLVIKNLKFDNQQLDEYNSKRFVNMFKGSNPHLFIDKAAQLVKLDVYQYSQLLHLIAQIDSDIPYEVLDKTADILIESGINFSAEKNSNQNYSLIAINITIERNGVIKKFTDPIKLNTRSQRVQILRLLDILKNKRIQ